MIQWIRGLLRKLIKYILGSDATLEALDRSSSGGEVFRDLDAVIETSVVFCFQGKDHKLQPINNTMFFTCMNQMAKIWVMAEENKITPKKFLDEFYALIKPLCTTISKNDISNMTQAQVGALYQLICDQVTGKFQRTTSEPMRPGMEPTSATLEKKNP